MIRQPILHQLARTRLLSALPPLQVLLAGAVLVASAALAVPAAAGAAESAPHAGHEGHAAHGETMDDRSHARHGSHPGAAAADEDPHAAHRAALEAAGEAAGDGAETTGAPEIPDLELLDQSGQPVRFYSDLVEGKVVAMNFVFTTCTTICPPMGANFGRLQKELGERLGRDVHLISVSVDPAIDTPERMRAWAENFGRDEGWTLVTGPKTRLDTVLKSLGAFTPDKTDHAPLVLVGNDARGTWLRVNGLASPEVIARAIERVAHGGHPAASAEAGEGSP